MDIQKLRKHCHIKVLENEGQQWLDRGFESPEEYYGPNAKIEGARFNRVGFYLMTSRNGSGLIDCWEEFRLKDGSFVSVRVPGLEETFKFRLDMLRDDLPNAEIRKLLRRVEEQGYRLPKDLRRRMRLADTRDAIRETGRNAALYANRFYKRLKKAKQEKEYARK